MDKNIQQLPGYQVNEYKIALVPHANLATHIMQVRKEFNEKFKVENPAIIIPHLILASFKQIQAAEARIINRLGIVAMASHPFKVELHDFGSYPSHTIFINVTTKTPITDLVKKIRHDTQRLMKLDADNKPHFMTDSHLTIAIKLKPWQYEKACQEYANKHFTGRFIANHILLLRRTKGEFKFKPIESFNFQNLPVDIKQGELF